MRNRVFVDQRLDRGPDWRGNACTRKGSPLLLKLDGNVIRNPCDVWHLPIVLRVFIVDSFGMLPAWALKQGAIATATAPTILAVQEIQTI
jgi:hypothetical protein